MFIVASNRHFCKQRVQCLVKSFIEQALRNNSRAYVAGLQYLFDNSHKFISDINKEPVTVNGWIKSVRQHKDVAFISLYDGTLSDVLQVVTKPECIKQLSFGSCVSVTGNLVKSSYPAQKYELLALNINLLGPCDPQEFPLKDRISHNVDYIRQLPHLRVKTPDFCRLLRVRNNARTSIHHFFQETGYCHIDTPVITSNDCEGAGETFYVKTEQELENQKVGTESSHFFGDQAHLTVSSQLHLEVATGSLPLVYTLSPTFRAEKSMSRHHLAEFYMLEAEIAFIDDLTQLMNIIESTIKSITSEVINSSAQDINHLWKSNDQNQQKLIEKMLNNPFHRVSYSEAIEILQKENENFQFKISWGVDLHKEHERYLVSHFDGMPVFITNFPASIKPFYAKPNVDESTVAACDLLVPGVGELVGGSLRDDDLERLAKKVETLNLTSSLQWYLDLRRYGSAPHGGYGLGFERYLQYLLGIKNIRDVIPFPRSYNNCKL